MQCFLCDQTADEDQFSFDANGSEIALCGRCIHRFKIDRTPCEMDFLREFQAVVFGYTTNYRCPQCWESIRFRGMFPRVVLCQDSKVLVHRECAKPLEDGKYYSLKAIYNREQTIAHDAPPKNRCLSCLAPVVSEGDSRFQNCVYDCSLCERGLCDRCKGESVIKEGKITECKVCEIDTSKTLIQKIKYLFS